MRLMLRERRWGKTHSLVTEVLASAGNPVLIVSSRQEAEKILRDYPDMNGKVQSLDSLSNVDRLRGRNYDEVFVDNLEMVLSRILPSGRLVLSTISEPVELI